VVGDVEIAADASVFYGAVVRGDTTSIRLGRGSNLQDNVVVHADPDFPATIGEDVTVGHAAVLHGCTVEDGALIGIGAIVLNGAVIGTGSLVGAGALVSPGTVIPPRSLVLGAPGKVRRELTDGEVAANLENSRRYTQLIAVHRAAGAAEG
jgi:carbonic anhydrase/acetyltransferase-like protein (isoleucine patch superfamily)